MIQRQTYLKVIDNTGASIVQCIGIPGTNNPQRAYTGDIITVTIKALRKSAIAALVAAGGSAKKAGKKKGGQKGPRVLEGRVVNALVVRVKKHPTSPCRFADNAVRLVNSKGAVMGTRRTGAVATFPLYRKRWWKSVSRGAIPLER